jgi:hypothetical protein
MVACAERARCVGNGRLHGARRPYAPPAVDAPPPPHRFLAPPVAHAPFTPAPQYFNVADGMSAPRTPTFNTVYADRHATVRNLSPLTDEQIAETDIIFRRRLGTVYPGSCTP